MTCKMVCPVHIADMTRAALVGSAEAAHVNVSLFVAVKDDTPMFKREDILNAFMTKDFDGILVA